MNFAAARLERLCYFNGAMRHYLEFEKPIADLEGKIEELRHLSDAGELNIAEEVTKLQSKADKQLRATYGKLSAWQKCQVARHPDRPHVSGYLAALIEDYTPLAGDRLYAEDKAMLGGLGRFRGFSCVVMGQEKGNDMQSRVTHNFGSARPEGYRKAQRLMKMAERFQLPIITLVDTAGAYPGVGAEERGQAEAIAKCIEVSLQLTVPVISLIIGEGGSGGAIAIATANKVMMLEHAIYSVISPEGCASILWRSADQKQEAAEALRLTAQDLHKLGVIDSVVREPLGGAHRSGKETMAAAGDAIEAALRDLLPLAPAELKSQRRERFLEIGQKGL
jgi:acetyl-CoA carboxylase carboxyl transferase subunit alpha|tara:strand:+ start:1708 stop:2712 length:1005 start_codon:yes stop_codon:yes gene_type:complete